MRLPFSVVLFILLAALQILAADPNELQETTQEKQSNHQKRRLSLQNTAEIQHCLVSSGDVGCGMFECFNNNSCEIRGLHDICLTFLHNAGKFDSQGKSFIKDALRCLAVGLRQRFSCVSRRCQAVGEMVYLLQRECYAKHNLCLVVRDNLSVMADMIHFHLLFPRGPHVELVNILLGCGEKVRSAIAHRIRSQCEQNWGALCGSLSHCSLSQSDGPQPLTPPSPTLQGRNTLPSIGPAGIPGPLPLQEARTAQPGEGLGLEPWLSQVAMDNPTEPGVLVARAAEPTTAT